MRKFVFLVGLFAFASAPALAQEGGSKDVTVGYSYVRANPATTAFPTFNANGGSASFTYNPRNFYGFAGEISGYHIGQIGSASVSTNRSRPTTRTLRASAASAHQRRRSCAAV